MNPDDPHSKFDLKLNTIIAKCENHQWFTAVNESGSQGVCFTNNELVIDDLLELAIQAGSPVFIDCGDGWKRSINESYPPGLFDWPRFIMPVKPGEEPIRVKDAFDRFFKTRKEFRYRIMPDGTYHFEPNDPSKRIASVLAIPFKRRIETNVSQEYGWVITRDALCDSLLEIHPELTCPLFLVQIMG